MQPLRNEKENPNSSTSIAFLAQFVIHFRLICSVLHLQLLKTKKISYTNVYLFYLIRNNQVISTLHCLILDERQIHSITLSSLGMFNTNGSVINLWNEFFSIERTLAQSFHKRSNRSQSHDDYLMIEYHKLIEIT